MNLEAILCTTLVAIVAISWVVFMFTFVRDDIRREKERKAKLLREKEMEEKYGGQAPND